MLGVGRKTRFGFGLPVRWVVGSWASEVPYSSRKVRGMNGPLRLNWWVMMRLPADELEFSTKAEQDLYINNLEAAKNRIRTSRQTPRCSQRTPHQEVSS